jgi:hypothetical protein
MAARGLLFTLRATLCVCSQNLRLRPCFVAAALRADWVWKKSWWGLELG